MTMHQELDVTAGPALFEQPVSRHLVHRAAVSEVMITGWRPFDEKTTILAAQWPRTHSFHRPVGGRHDPLLIAETIRQAGLVVSHAELGCPLDHQFLLWELSYEADLGDLTIGTGPTNLVLRFTRSQVRHRGRNLAGLRAHVDLYRDGRLVGMGEGAFDCVSRAAYDRLRAAARPGGPPAPLPEPVAPALVGRDRPEDVVLGPAGLDDAWLLRVDPAHPVLFDHTVDHVPGMALMEAMRQAAMLLVQPAPVTPAKLYASFNRYVELRDPAIVRAHPEEVLACGDVPVRVTIEQYGTTASSGLVVARPQRTG
ncbi:ScbA/BarX family gamma-butyrolactone biosynthesis protein [Sphaerisporangium corydalis]|uniref:ScbA/BarX family gamma-butyrolactone biosynthesis protein n=1 Tax=Sphaerisporangium corydalis TaxID=1441875 RepID=A0ABV9EKY3_9ACTN|nr:ScbA/BarX family gamma-butyrolactone biosynthesis protein [Sphaerisporangium corydalis]